MPKVEDLQKGDIISLEGSTKEGERQTVFFEILETGYYPSPVQPTTLAAGAKCRACHNGIIGVFFFILLDHCKKVDDATIVPRGSAATQSHEWDTLSNPACPVPEPHDAGMPSVDGSYTIITSHRQELTARVVRQECREDYWVVKGGAAFRSCDVIAWKKINE